MNNTLNAMFEERAVRRRTGPAQVRAAAGTDLACVPAPGLSMLAGAQALLAQTQVSGSGAYFKNITLLHLTAAVVLLLAAVGVWIIAETSLWLRLAALALAALSLLNLHRALTLPAPAHISPERLALAHKRPVDAGDEGQTPLNLTHLVIIGAVVLGDAALAGTALLGSALGSNLTADQIVLASVVWAFGFGFLLIKIVQAAAAELAENRRRRTIHRLLGSPDESDRERGRRMKEEVGAVLDHDVTLRKDRIRARVALWTVVALVTAAVFTARMSAETAPLDLGGQAPAAMQPSVKPVQPQGQAVSV